MARVCGDEGDEEPFPNAGNRKYPEKIPSSDCRSGRRGVEETDEREPQESAVAFVLDCVTNVVGMSQELTSRASRAVRSTGPRSERRGEDKSHLRPVAAVLHRAAPLLRDGHRAGHTRAIPSSAAVPGRRVASRRSATTKGSVAQENETDRENVPVRGHFRVRPHGRVPRRVRHAFGGVP